MGTAAVPFSGVILFSSPLPAGFLLLGEAGTQVQSPAQAGSQRRKNRVEKSPLHPPRRKTSGLHAACAAGRRLKPPQNRPSPRRRHQRRARPEYPTGRRARRENARSPCCWLGVALRVLGGETSDEPRAANPGRRFPNPDSRPLAAVCHFGSFVVPRPRITIPGRLPLQMTNDK